MSTTTPRPRWTSVAVTALAAVGVAACGGGSGETTSTSSPTSTTAPAGVTHEVDLPPFPPIHLVAPASWDAVDDWAFNRDPCDESGCTEADTAMAVLFWRVTRIYGHPCDWAGTLVDPGPSVDDLATALHDVPTRQASEPAPVEVGGVDGLYMDWSVPDDANFADCDEGYFESWEGDVGGTDRYQQLPGQVDRLWILDVNGERLVIDAFYLPGTPEADRQEIDDIIDSIEIG